MKRISKLGMIMITIISVLLIINTKAIADEYEDFSYRDIKLDETVELDSQEVHNSKDWFYDLTNLAGNGILTKVSFDVTCPFSNAGWSGGNGGVGMNFGEFWWEFNNMNGFGPEAVPQGQIAPDTFHIEVTVPETYMDEAQNYENGVFRIGWWWGGLVMFALSQILLFVSKSFNMS